jgi:predicted HD superfamily hydrolase involved in NAD metabolism
MVSYQQLEQLDYWVKRLLSPDRLHHSLSVAKVAVALAKREGLDDRLANFVGIGHDVAKELPQAKQTEWAKALNRYYPCDEHFPQVLHGRLAADFIKQTLGFYCEEADNAMSKHTVGSVIMSNLDKVLFIADTIEPTRPYYNKQWANYLANENLDSLYFKVLSFKINHHYSCNEAIYPTTLEYYTNLKELYAKNI